MLTSDHCVETPPGAPDRTQLVTRTHIAILLAIPAFGLAVWVPTQTIRPRWPARGPASIELDQIDRAGERSAIEERVLRR